MFEESDLIYSYTRADAIRDGVLIDVSETAKEAGFKWNTCVTSTLWNEYIVPAPELVGQDISGRLWDMLTVLRYEAKRQNSSEIYFSVLFQMKNNKRQKVQLKAIAGHGDAGEPVITIMLPNED